jgi:hypothetical protein
MTSKWTNSLEELGAHYEHKFIHPELARYIAQIGYLNPKLGHHDRQCPEALTFNSVAGIEILTEFTQKKVELVTGLKLLPTSCYMRIYYNGVELKRHKDSPWCEYSASIHLDGNNPNWPFEYINKKGEHVKEIIGQGGALFYKGCEITHWREPYKGEWYAQIFIHYVDANGPHKDLENKWLAYRRNR